MANSRRPAAYGVEAILPFHLGCRTSIMLLGMSSPFTTSEL